MLVHMQRLRFINQNQAHAQLYEPDKKNAYAHLCLCVYTVLVVNPKSKEIHRIVPLGYSLITAVMQLCITTHSLLLLA